MANLVISDENENEPLRYKDAVVLTSEKLAQELGTTTDVLKNNFSRNKAKYELGIHYFLLEGAELKAFKSEVTNRYLVAIPNNVNKFYLWTEKGAFNHMKSVGTDEAWDHFQHLVEKYFRQKEFIQAVVEKAQAQVVTPLTEAEMLLKSAQLLVDVQRKQLEQEQKQEAQENRINDVEQTVKEVKAKQTTMPADYYAIAGYASLVNRKIDVPTAAKLGMKAKALCHRLGASIGRIPDPRFGMVGTYPIDVLKTVFDEFFGTSSLQVVK